MQIQVYVARAYHVPHERPVVDDHRVERQLDGPRGPHARRQLPPQQLLHLVGVALELRLILRAPRGAVEEGPAEELLDILPADRLQGRAVEPLGQVVLRVRDGRVAAVEQRLALRAGGDGRVPRGLLQRAVLGDVDEHVEGDLGDGDDLEEEGQARGVMVDDQGEDERGDDERDEVAGGEDADANEEVLGQGGPDHGGGGVGSRPLGAR